MRKFRLRRFLALVLAVAMLLPMVQEIVPTARAETTFTISFAAPQSWSGYTVKANVCRSNGESNWQTVEMTKTGDTYTYNGTTYDLYSASVTEIYGGFDQIQFQRYSGNSWQEQYVANSSWVLRSDIEGKMYIPNVGWFDYATDSKAVTEAVITGPTRTVYFDATLSKLSYNNSTDKGNATIPWSNGDSEGSNVYIYFWGSATNGSGHVIMDKVSAYTSGGHIWSDVYSAQIPADTKNIIFYSNTELGFANDMLSAQTVDLTMIDADAYINPCFYADSSDKVIFENAKRGGYWGEVYSVRNAEAGKNTDVVDIGSGNFTQNADTLYLNTTFYDYYTDYELNGNNRDSYDSMTGGSFQAWYTFRQLNQALSDYYKSNNVKIPLYIGHFQPDWDDWGYSFSTIAGTLGLYGYKDGKAYGTTDTDQMYFMSVNNSNMDIKPSIDHVNEAAQGLVYNTLVNNALMSVDKSSGTVALPYFNEAFLSGQNSKNTVLGQIYNNVSFPFTKKVDPESQVEYWTFDSSETTLTMKQTSAGKYYLEKVTDTNDLPRYENVDSGSNGQGTQGFFPFNSGSTAATASTYNYGFGTRIDLTFRLTEDGTVLNSEGKKVNIKFNFSGDDDVWVFIDGQLALDVGGDHGKVTGSLDFATKTATVSGVKVNPGSSSTDKSKTFQISGSNTDEHTLTMFYMERGMWESNMKITFNFPDENLLQVEKEVDDSDVNEIFDGVFDNKALFTFTIKNLVTHFGTVGVSGKVPDPTTIILSAATAASSYDGNTFTIMTDGYADKAPVVKWYAQLDDIESLYRDRRQGILTFPSAVDISQMSKLSFWMYYNDTADFALNQLYLQLADSDGTTIGCNSETSSLSGKVYGVPDTSGGQWVKITLDLSKFDDVDSANFNKAKVTKLIFGCDLCREIYLADITFEPIAEAGTATGFITQQQDIPDYGSAASGTLMAPDGAIYISSNGSADVVSNGSFVLENGETVSFYDQFRRGSYIYLEEALTEQQKVLFDTTWTMYENGIPVTSFGTGSTVSGNVSSMVDQTTLYVDDGRTENKDSDNECKYNGTRPGNSFVFRSYANPDSTAITTKLKAVFTNKVNVGHLTITKGNSGTETLSSSFTFYVEFYNVGGLGLESAPIVKEYSINVGETITIDGIPLGTQYRIFEVKSDDEISLDNVTLNDTEVTFTNITADSAIYSYVSGTVSTEGKTDVYVFNNEKKSTVSFQVTKEWEDADSNTMTSGMPASITVQLQRRKSSSGSWTAVTNYEDVVIRGSYTGWTKTFTDLDKYYSGTNAYQYRVVELDSAGNVISEGDTLDNTYKVSYGKVTESDGTFTQTITNTQIAPATLKITKVVAKGSNASWSSEEFRIQVTLNGKLLSVGTTYTVGSVTKTVTTDGIIVLKAGETAVISGITAGSAYSVTEVRDPKGRYQASYSGSITNSGTASATALSITGTLPEGSVGDITVTNRNRGSHVVVIDFGIPVDITVLDDDFKALSGTLAGVGSVSSIPSTYATTDVYGNSYPGTFGVAAVNGTKIRYTLSESNGMQMATPEVFGYAIKFTEDDATKYYYSTVTVIPAANIYYEDSFLKFKDSSYATDTYGKWSRVYDTGIDWNSAYGSATQAEDRPGTEWPTGIDANNVYGYDAAYDNCAMFSLGSAMKVTVDAATGKTTTAPQATFTFTGTGFDVVSLTDSNSGAITVEVKDASGKSVKKYIVNNYYGYSYQNGQWVVNPDSTDCLWQVPVIKVEGLTYGTYTVTIRAAYLSTMDYTGTDGSAGGSYSFWLDAIRIYNPANPADSNFTTVTDAYKKDDESNPTLVTLKKLIVAAGSFTVDGSTGAVFIDGKQTGSKNSISITDYKFQGPNNETYLAGSQGVAFKLVTNTNPDSIQSIQIGAKLARGSSAVLKQGTATLTTLTCATNMFYELNDITWTKSGSLWTSDVIVLSCTDNDGSSNVDSMISLTDLKITADTAISLSNTTGVSTVDLMDETTEPTMTAAVDEETGVFSLRTMRALYLFQPETFEASWTGTTVGLTSYLTVKTSEDVESILVNGEEITSYRTVTTYTGSWWNMKKVTYRVFTTTVTCGEAGTYDYQIVAVNEDGLISDPIDAPLTVKESKLISWIRKLFG